VPGRLLVVAGATLDSVDGGPWRPGGPGLYAAAAAGALGCSVDVLGPLGVDDAWLVARAYRSLGARLLGPLTPGCSYRFRHAYTPGGRVSRVECRPAPLGPDSLAAAGLDGYDALLVSPVHCEVSPEAAAHLAVNAPAAVRALDVQGFARCYGHIPSRALGGYTVVHASSDDTPRPPRARAGLVAYTLGPGGGVLLSPRGVEARIPEPPRLLGDPTGAGDAFTASLACLLSEGLSPGEAAGLAVEATVEALEAARAQGF